MRSWEPSRRPERVSRDDVAREMVRRLKGAPQSAFYLITCATLPAAEPAATRRTRHSDLLFIRSEKECLALAGREHGSYRQGTAGDFEGERY